MALPFFTKDFNLSEYQLDIIYPEYIDGGYKISWSTPATPAANMSYAQITGLSIYDYILMPLSINIYASFTVGLVNDELNITNTRAGIGLYGSGDGRISSSYAFLNNTNSHFDKAITNVCSNMKYPVIGFKRTRADGVNPLGLIQPLDPGALEPNDPEPDPEER